MFKNKPAQLDGQVDTLIGAQVVVHGDLKFSGGLYVEGRIVGKVIAEEGQRATITLAENGSIEGEVRAPVVILNGRLDGWVPVGGLKRNMPTACASVLTTRVPILPSTG